MLVAIRDDRKDTPKNGPYRADRCGKMRTDADLVSISPTH